MACFTPLYYLMTRRVKHLFGRRRDGLGDSSRAHSSISDFPIVTPAETKATNCGGGEHGQR